MLTISQYRENIGVLMKKTAEYDAVCQAQNRDLTESEIEAKNKILDDIEELRKIVTTLERQERVSEELFGTESGRKVGRNRCHPTSN